MEGTRHQSRFAESCGTIFTLCHRPSWATLRRPDWNNLVDSDNGDSGGQWRSAFVLVRSRSVQSGGSSDQPGAIRQSAGCQHHGSHSEYKHHAVWDVPDPHQPTGGSSNRCGDGCSHASAMRACDCCAMDDGRTNSVDRQPAGAGQPVEVHVHLAWRDYNHLTGPDRRTDPMTLMQSVWRHSLRHLGAPVVSRRTGVPWRRSAIVSAGILASEQRTARATQARPLGERNA